MRERLPSSSADNLHRSGSAWSPNAPRTRSSGRWRAWQEPRSWLASGCRCLFRHEVRERRVKGKMRTWPASRERRCAQFICQTREVSISAQILSQSLEGSLVSLRDLSTDSEKPSCIRPNARVDRLESGTPQFIEPVPDDASAMVEGLLGTWIEVQTVVPSKSTFGELGIL